MLELLTDPQAWLAFLTLSALEIVLGIDNIIFISVLVGRLPPHQRARARNFGLLLAMWSRIGLLLSIVWLIGLTRPWFNVLGNEISGRDLVLIVGGLFLLGKSVLEIHHTLEGAADANKSIPVYSSFMLIIVQIGVIDIVFSLDSVFTAVGLADDVPIMVAAIIVAVLVMMLLAGPISNFVEEHPTVKVLALAFLIMVGMALIADGLDTHVPKGYLYFAMAFSVSVEMINLRLRKALDRRRAEKAE
ncbi:MAG TPA: TerC family protein [Steroidobacteraceae bacterium]|nr:TerC family protein [Steroidobacteraceae bacterium]